MVLYIAWGGWNWFIDRPVHPADGVLAPDDPEQGEVLSGDVLRRDHWSLKPRASYRITARILSVERYHLDALASLVPEDFALGWGPLSDNRVLDTVSISQSHRFYYARLSDRSVSPAMVISHSANTHVIAESIVIAKMLARLRRGQVVTLTGVLVDAVKDDGMSIKTSLVRTDTGAGACEVLLVHDVSLVR